MALFGLDRTRSQLIAQYVTGPAAAAVAGLVVRFGDRLTGWVGANLRAMPNADARLDLLESTPGTVRSASALPLVADGTLVGVLTLYSPEPLSDDQSRTIEMIAPQLAAAVAAVEAANVTPAAETGRTAAATRARSGMRVVARR